MLALSIAGITGGNIAVAQAAIGDISDDTNRQKNFGLLGAAFGLGFIIGPYLGGKLSEPGVSFYGLFTTPSWFSATTPFWFATGLCVLKVVLVLTRFPETIARKDPDKRIAFGTSVSNVVRGFTSPRLRMPVVAERLPDHRALRFAFFGVAAAMSGFFLASSSWQLWALIPVFTFFNGLVMANQSSLISRSAEPGRQGEAMGISSSVMNLAQVPASILVGFITGSITSNTPLVVATVCIAAAGAVFVAFFRPTYVSTGQAGAATRP
jgi:DHA1 family tetracycline resistance protein-like MFS transporter